MITLHCPMPRKLFTNIPMFSTLQNDVEMFLQGRIQYFFRRGCTRLLLYFNTNKPDFFFFLQYTSCIRKPQVISGGGGGAQPLHPPPRSAPVLPSKSSYHYPNNVSDIFVKAQLPGTNSCNNVRATAGSFRCNTSKCTTCPRIAHGLHRNLSFRTLSQQ